MCRIKGCFSFHIVTSWSHNVTTPFGLLVSPCSSFSGSSKRQSKWGWHKVSNCEEGREILNFFFLHIFLVQEESRKLLPPKHDMGKLFSSHFAPLLFLLTLTLLINICWILNVLLWYIFIRKNICCGILPTIAAAQCLIWFKTWGGPFETIPQKVYKPI